MSNKGQKLNFKDPVGRAKKISLTKRHNFDNGITVKLKGKENHNWKGGVGNRNSYLEIIAGRSKPELCEICSGVGKIVFDHDHATGQFRGWICFHCNSTLGFARDKVEVLQKMINYLKKDQGRKITDQELSSLSILPTKDNAF